jgi:hypothetical protein
MVNSPPGIQTIPGGALAGDAAVAGAGVVGAGCDVVPEHPVAITITRIAMPDSSFRKVRRIPAMSNISRAS